MENCFRSLKSKQARLLKFFASTGTISYSKQIHSSPSFRSPPNIIQLVPYYRWNMQGIVFTSQAREVYFHVMLQYAIYWFYFSKTRNLVCDIGKCVFLGTVSMGPSLHLFVVQTFHDAKIKIFKDFKHLVPRCDRCVDSARIKSWPKKYLCHDS